MRLVIASCAVDYAGRLAAHLPMAKRLIMIKADGSVCVHCDDRAYKPLNWMSPPCQLSVLEPDEAQRDNEVTQVWQVRGAKGETLQIALGQVFADFEDDLGVDPGLVKDGVEAHLQALLAENPEAFGAGYRLVQREYATAIGPVDLLLRTPSGGYAAVEVKRRGEIDGVEQLTRYLELMRRDPLLGDVQGIFAAQAIKPQARTLAVDRGIACVVVDYDGLRGLDHADERLF
ncbi:MAG: endonuclease NucS [Propionibacteriaceae bacterium]|nr:endonuclease NucS [Propionibacteriaceae bacterium]